MTFFQQDARCIVGIAYRASGALYPYRQVQRIVGHVGYALVVVLNHVAIRVLVRITRMPVMTNRIPVMTNPAAAGLKSCCVL